MRAAFKAVSITFAVWAAHMCGPALATQPPPPGQPFPEAYFKRLQNDPASFTFKRSLMTVTERARVARQLTSEMSMISSGISPLADQISPLLGANSGELPPTAVQGERQVPVLTARYSNGAASSPFATSLLQQQLFQGPWPTGTMTDYYKEISGGKLKVGGTVKDWVKLPKDSNFYQGAPYMNSSGQMEECRGLCNSANMVAFIKDTIARNGNIDWSQYDNDGPDGIPNSGDDDGYVDFVAFVHEGKGGECSDAGNKNIWSHRSSVSSWGSVELTTTSPSKNGGFIKIDDYVVMPALACDGTTMVQIGVFAHEFGHAFGLPDLYDTDKEDGRSSGLGTWCLMAGGSWGADGHSPERPSHMSAWAKAFLGWIDVEDIDTDKLNTKIPPIQTARKAYKIRGTGKIHYLINATASQGFDASLPGPGLQIWRVNETVVKAGLSTNRVNADNSNPGVWLMEADGKNLLAIDGHSSSRDDLYPFPVNGAGTFDSASRPASIGSLALCDVRLTNGQIFASAYVSRNKCPATPAVASFNPTNEPAASAPTTTTPATIEGANSLAVGSAITVSGTLVNTGSNYFDRRTRRIVLIDEKGHEIPVAIQAYLEATSAGPTTANAPESSPLSSYLQKRVEVSGVIAPAAPGSEQKVLKVQNLRVRPQ